VIAFAAEFRDAVLRPAEEEKAGLGSKLASLFGRSKKN
jgi:hypothetical protein